MSTALWVLFGYVTWTLLLVASVGGWRATEVLRGKARPNGFPSGERHGSDLYWRLNRAHANATENLGIVAAVMLSGHVLGTGGALFDTAAITLLAGRVLQSFFHVSSGRSLVVNLRFAAFLTQLVCLVLCMYALATGAGG